MKSTNITLLLCDQHALVHWTAHNQHTAACFNIDDPDWPIILQHRRRRITAGKVSLVCQSKIVMHQRIACDQPIKQDQLQHYARCQLQAYFAQPAESLYFDIVELDNKPILDKQILWLAVCQRNILDSIMTVLKRYKLRLHAIWLIEQLMLELTIRIIPQRDAVAILINGENLFVAWIINNQIIDIGTHHHISLLANNFNQWPNSNTLPRYVVSNDDKDDELCKRLMQSKENCYWLQLYPRYRWHCSV